MSTATGAHLRYARYSNMLPSPPGLHFRKYTYTIEFRGLRESSGIYTEKNRPGDAGVEALMPITERWEVEKLGGKKDESGTQNEGYGCEPIHKAR